MFQRILVPVDGSTFGEHALPWAMSIARRAEARIELVHVHESISSLEVMEWGAETVQQAIQEGKDNARAYLDDLAERVRSIAPCEVEATFLEGRVGDALLEHAEHAKPDLIVLTTHGRGPLSRFWLGSVADELVRRATMPLLLIRPDENTPDLQGEPPLRRILIPLDGSSFAEQILEPAIALGSLTQAEYRLLRVVRLAVTTGPDPWFSPPLHVPDVDLLDQARNYLKRVWERLQEERSVTVRAHAISAFNPAEVILDDAETRHVDLIALATHGRSGLARVFLGSVADKVVRGAKVPVLVQRPVAEAGE